MSWAESIKTANEVIERSNKLLENLKREIANVIDDNIYIVPSSNLVGDDVITGFTFNRTITSNKEYGTSNDVIMKRKGTVRVYGETTPQYSSNISRYLYIDVFVNDVKTNSFTVELKPNYTEGSNYVDVPVAKGDVVKIEYSTSVLGFDKSVRLRGKLKIKGGLVE